MIRFQEKNEINRTLTSNAYRRHIEGKTAQINWFFAGGANAYYSFRRSHRDITQSYPHR